MEKNPKFLSARYGRGIQSKKKLEYVFFPKGKALKCVKICLLLSKDRRQRQSITWRSFSLISKDFFPIIELYHRRISKRQTSLSFFAHLGHFVALKKRFCCGDKRILKFEDPRKAANGFL